MEATAKLKHLKMSPRKVRLVADMIRGERLDKALNALTFLEKRAARPMETLLRSAAANAGNKEGMDTESLFVSRVVVNGGPTAKRIMPRAMGRANIILKRTSHIQITLEDRPVKIKTPKTEPKPAEKADLSETETTKKTRKKAVKKAAAKKGAAKKSTAKKAVKKPAGTKKAKKAK